MRGGRREFLAAAGGAAVVGLFGGLVSARAAQIGAIGIQLFTLRDMFSKDPVGTLEQVAAIGYREVEFGGGNYETMDPGMLRSTLDRLGMRAPSTHISYEALMGSFDASVKRAKTLGADCVVLPNMSPQHLSADAWETALRNMNQIAAKLRDAGLSFAYHNHAFEFTVKPDGVSLFDRFLAGTDESLVKYELDLYWALRAGEDLSDIVRRLAPRLYSFHVKDRKTDGSMAAVGTGTIDFAAIFRLPGSAAVRHFYVENDQAPAPYIPDITQSFQHLRALQF